MRLSKGGRTTRKGKKRREKRGIDAAGSQYDGSGKLRQRLAEDGARQTEENYDKNAERSVIGLRTHNNWKRDSDPRRYTPHELTALLVADSQGHLKLREGDRDRINDFLKDATLRAARDFHIGRPIGFFADLLERNGVSMVDFILQNSSDAAQAMRDYIAHFDNPDKGRANARLLQSLIAMMELHQMGYFNGQISGGEPPTSLRISALRPLIELSDEDRDEVLDAYEVTENEITAIEHYTNAQTNSRMADSFGSVREGWYHLDQAIRKFPSTGELGVEHAGFRVSRTLEGNQIEPLAEGTQIYHGNRRMGHGQGHYMSTATTYSGFSRVDRVGDAGSIVAISGTSGRYINPFGVQGTMTDGAEVLYPPGTLSTYEGTTRNSAVPVHHLRELDRRAPMNPQMVEDLDYTNIRNPFYAPPNKEKFD